MGSETASCRMRGCRPSALVVRELLEGLGFQYLGLRGDKTHDLDLVIRYTSSVRLIGAQGCGIGLQFDFFRT